MLDTRRRGLINNIITTHCFLPNHHSKLPQGIFVANVRASKVELCGQTDDSKEVNWRELEPVIYDSYDSREME